MKQVIIGVDPHKVSATIEVVDRHEKLLGSGRFSTDQAGYTALRTYVRTWPERVPPRSVTTPDDSNAVTAAPGRPNWHHTSTQATRGRWPRPRS